MNVDLWDQPYWLKAESRLWGAAAGKSWIGYPAYLRRDALDSRLRRLGVRDPHRLLTGRDAIDETLAQLDLRRQFPSK